jgi:hypothetical protein
VGGFRGLRALLASDSFSPVDYPEPRWLSAREEEVARLVAQGLSNAEVGEQRSSAAAQWVPPAAITGGSDSCPVRR